MTVCPGWSVKDVALHLLGVNVANISRRRDGFGDAFAAFVPRAADPTDPITLVETIANWNEAWVVATRRLSPRLLCTLLTVTGKEIEAFYRDLDLLAQGNAVSWAGPDLAPVWLDIAREYTEQWVHQAQIRDALKLPMLDEPRLFAPVLDKFMWALPYTLRDMAWPPDTALRVVITGDAGSEWWTVRRDDQWVLRREADATVTMDQATVASSIAATTLLAPFDPLLMGRSRSQRLFGFDHRIEFYVPKEKRIYGYFVLPQLLNDELVTSTDVRFDRESTELVVLGSQLRTADADIDLISNELANNLIRLAAWLGARRVAVSAVEGLGALLRRRLKDSF